MPKEMLSLNESLQLNDITGFHIEVHSYTDDNEIAGAIYADGLHPDIYGKLLVGCIQCASKIIKASTPEDFGKDYRFFAGFNFLCEQGFWDCEVTISAQDEYELARCREARQIAVTENLEMALLPEIFNLEQAMDTYILSQHDLRLYFGLG